MKHRKLNHRWLDRTGIRYDRLVAIEYVGESKWRCQCDCGRIVVIWSASLNHNRPTNSCGCAKFKPFSLRKKNFPLYLVWKEMHARCERATHAEYRLYGARGIKVCERWDSFANFIEDMAPRPEGMSLDRIDSDGGYEPANCRWATATEQSRNTRRNRYLEFDGKRMSLADWADTYGITRCALTARLKRGWTLEDALTVPVRPFPSPKGSAPTERLPGRLTPIPGAVREALPHARRDVIRPELDALHAGNPPGLRQPLRAADMNLAEQFAGERPFEVNK